MLADQWVLIQLFSGVISTVLLGYAVFFAIKIHKNWKINSRSDTQIALERQSFLISIIARYVLFFQVILLFVFIQTVNVHLPGLIAGAMCADGVLTVNPYGMPLLYLKSIGLFFYMAFIFVNYLDESEPEYPLTPSKYIWLYPAAIILLIDNGLSFAFFGQIEPDVIASCCSVDFSQNWLENSAETGRVLFNSEIYFYASLLLVLVTSVGKLKNNWINFIAVILFVLFAVISLKNNFVKFIYGLPSHNCLFDIFWGQYNYIGFILFLLLFCVVFTSLAGFLLLLLKNKLRTEHKKMQNILGYLTLASSLWYGLILLSYKTFW